MMRSTSISLCSVLLAIAASPVSGQPPSTEDSTVPVLHAQARVVEIDVVVTDSRGKAVTDLSKQDFTLLDEGKPRQIDIFSMSRGEPVTAPPRDLPDGVFSNSNSAPAVTTHDTLIVLNTVSTNPQADYYAWQGASASAKVQIMAKRPADRIALYVISRQQGMVVLQEYTSDRELLLKALKGYPEPSGRAVGSPWTMTEAKQNADAAKSIANGESPRRDPNMVPARETEFYLDTAERESQTGLQAVAERLALVPGRKNVSWAGPLPARTHGIFQLAWDKTITALNEANISLNMRQCSDSLREIAERTGGSTACPGVPGPGAVMEASRTIYTLGFYLADAEKEDKFRGLTVKVNRPHTELFYRRGYDAGDKPQGLHERKPEMEMALLNEVEATDVGITARLERGTDGSGVTLRITLDPAKVSLKAQLGGWAGKVEEEFVELNESGRTLAKISDKKEFEVTADQRAQYDREGVTWPFAVPLQPGATKIGIVVRDSATGRLGSLTIPLQ